jgi:hypothetical protein
VFRDVADQLPSLPILDTEGREVDLRSLAADRRVLLAYVRHFA